jgi:SAM-dependent methyltransferase
MAGSVLTLRGAAYRATTALRGLRDRALYPATEDPDEHWQRIALNRAVDARIARSGPERQRAAEISGHNHAGRSWREYVSLSYPEFDLCAPLQEERRFDVVICEQVLEHVPDPVAACANLRRLCVPGGQVIVSTPFLVKVHELPEYAMHDYWRFTPRGLRLLLERVGLEVEEVGGWGNRQCIAGNIRTWSAYRPWHSLHNEADLPVQVWAFARNPGEG